VKVQKCSRIGIVVADETLRATQRVDGRLVTANIPIGKDFKKSLRQLLTSSPFVGKEVVVGLEGGSVLIETLVVPAGASKSARALCSERLKGDPVFNEERAVLGVAVAHAASGAGPSVVILAAVDRAKVADVMRCCREIELSVVAVESAALAAWRAWSGPGIQVRLIRSNATDIVLAGVDSKLMFCRIVSSPIALGELRATISRAASLLAAEGFETLTTTGVDERSKAEMASSLGLSLKAPEEAVDDAAAVGLATVGPILTEFTPPEERVLREKRRLRRARASIAASVILLGGVAGVLGYGRIDDLEDRKQLLEQRVQAHLDAEAEVGRVRAEIAAAEAKEVLLDRAVPGHRMSRVFELLANAAPASMVLETIKVDDVPESAAGAAPTARALEIHLSGLAADADAVQDFADALLETTAFTAVKVESSGAVVLSGGAKGERFRIYARAETY